MTQLRSIFLSQCVNQWKECAICEVYFLWLRLIYLAKKITKDA